MQRHASDKTDRTMTAGLLITLIVSAAPIVAFLVHSARESGRNAEVRVSSSTAAPRNAIVALDGRLRFEDVARQSREFIGYWHSVRLTPEQEAIKAEALTKRPAACCRSSNAYTCCCHCNLSKTVWGLSNYAIATHHLNAKELSRLVDQWLAFANPSGYSGTTCYVDGCGRQFHANGCGGMSESNLVL